ncbi:MAG: M20/M25/M40 family metallo-hydrolase [Nitriliruptorales bacterium]
MGLVELLSELVRVRSVNPPGDGETQVAELLRARLDAAGCDTRIVTGPGGRPSLVARLRGPTERPTLVLLSHTDVVPVEQEAWRRDPFGAEVVDGELWGRGTLDMKGVAVLHVEAMAALAGQDRDLKRELIVVAAADEEAGGAHGAEWLVRDHGELVGFHDGDAPPPEVLGEGGFGLAGLSSRPIMPIVLGEKSPLTFRARATGRSGHGSLPPDQQAIRSLARFLEAVAGPRPARLYPILRQQLHALADAADGALAALFRVLASPAGPAVIRTLAPLVRARATLIGQVISDTITPTCLRAGYKSNVVPSVAEAIFDGRLLPDSDPDELLAWLRRAARPHAVEIEELRRWRSTASPHTALFDLLADVSAHLPGAPVPVPSLTPAVTDLRFFRARGAVAYGWVPFILTPELVTTIHGHDERVPLIELHRARDAMSDVVRRACV